jgi:hypothetical protein
VIARVASTAVIVSALARGAFGDPIQMHPSRFISGHASITDATGMGAREFLDQSTTADGIFDASAAATAETDIASLSIVASQHTTIDAAQIIFSDLERRAFRTCRAR